MKRQCFVLLMVILCMHWIFYFLLTVDVHTRMSNSVFVKRFQLQSGFNKTQYWKDILPDVVAVKKSPIAVASTTFQNKPPFAVKSNKDVIKLFNTTFLTKNQSDSKAPRTLHLHSDLLGFQKLYNQHGDIGYSVLRYGKIRDKPGFLTIGLPTVKRPLNDHYYLKATLNSLISNIMEDKKEMITIVIFMADPDESWNNRTANEIHTEFKLFIESGLIHIIIAPQNIYPNLKTLNKTKHDSVDRVRWRSKQNVDFAFLMMYCEKLNKYYIQLEDDLLVAPDFINYIETFVSNQTNHWFCLEFSILGFIGKMFYSSDLFKMAATFLANYKLFPCDIQLGWIRGTMGQIKPIHSPESLFQHIGKISSLKDKMMPSIDNKFKGFGSIALSIMTMQKGDNPPAKFETNMHMVNVTSYPPENVYKNNSHFQASNLNKFQYFKIIFEKYWNLSRIVISTGDEKTKKDILISGVLKIGALNEKQPGKSCLDLIQIGKFIEGEFDSLIQGLHFPNINIKCLQIEVTKKQKQWLIIRDIAIFTK